MPPVRILLVVSSLMASSGAFSQVATLVRASGQVEVLKDPGTASAEAPSVLYDGKRYKSEPVKKGMRFGAGLIVKTGSESKATLIYQNGDMLTVAADTFHIVKDVKATDGKPVMELIYGTVRAQVAKDGPNSGLEVKTRTTAMGVRGTDFTIKRPGTTGDSEVIVLRGEVEVKGTAPGSKPAAVKAGGTAVIAAPAESGAAQPAVVVKPADQATLVAVQKATAPVPASDQQESPEIVALEKKATANILKDIKATDPKLHAELTKDGTLASTYALNAAQAEKVFKAAPPPANAPAPSAADAKLAFEKTPPPAGPDLVEPAAEAGLSTGEDERRMDFAWRPVPRATRYEIQVSRSPNFALEPPGETLAETRHSRLLVPSTWFWRVRASDAEGRTGPWSQTRRFSIGRMLSPDEKARLQAEPKPTAPPKEREPKSEPAPVAEAQPDPGAPEPETSEPKEEEAPKEASKPDSSQSFWLALGLGGGSYTYSSTYGGATTSESGGGGGLSLYAAYRVLNALELQAAVAQRSYDKLKDGDTFDTSLMDFGARYFFGLTDTVDWGTGLTYAREGLPHPTIESEDLKEGTLELVFAALTLAPRAWPVMGWRAELGYSVIGGGEKIDVRDDRAFYLQGGYERQWFTMPLSLGLVVKRSERSLTIREKDGLDGVEITLKRTDVMLRAGYGL